MVWTSNIRIAVPIKRRVPLHSIVSIPLQIKIYSTSVSALQWAWLVSFYPIHQVSDWHQLHYWWLAIFFVTMQLNWKQPMFICNHSQILKIFKYYCIGKPIKNIFNFVFYNLCGVIIHRRKVFVLMSCWLTRCETPFFTSSILQ